VVRVAVLIPCFNEATTIGQVVTDFKSEDPSLEVYVYDNNSTDNSASLAMKAGAIVVPEYRQGKGFVIRSMFRDIEADCYVMVDGDSTYLATDALRLSEQVLTGRADMVIGDRLSTSYFSQNRRALHGLGNRLVRFLVNRIFHSDIHDIMTGSRAFSRRFVKSFPVLSSGFEIETEMTIHALDKDFLLQEVPITYRDRPEGSTSKLHTLSDGTRVIRTILSLFKDYRPFAFFGLIAVALFVLAIGLFLIPFGEYLETGKVARIPLLITSVGLGIGALLSLVCAVVLDAVRKQSRQFYELLLTTCATPSAQGRSSLVSGSDHEQVPAE
jgi:glycosyltransferase involved in cell wall biosynthesis